MHVRSCVVCPIEGMHVDLSTSASRIAMRPFFFLLPDLVEQNCDLKLCDFGLSRGVQDDQETGDLTE